MSSFFRLLSVQTLALFIVFGTVAPAMAQFGVPVLNNDVFQKTGSNQGNAQKTEAFQSNLTFSGEETFTNKAVSYTIINTGIGETENGFEVQYRWFDANKSFLSGLTGVVGKGKPLSGGQTIAVNLFPAGSPSDVTNFVFIPPDEPGQSAFFLEVRIDPGNKIAELDEADNTIMLSRPVGLPAAAPASANVLPNFAIENATLTKDMLSFVVKNTEMGVPKSAGFLVQYQWYTADNEPSGSPVAFSYPDLLGSDQSVTITTFPGGPNSIVNNVVFFPAPDASVLKIWVNYNTAVPEKTFTDNKVFLDLPAPDIEIAGAVLEEDGVTVVVENEGTEDADQSVSVVVQWVKDDAPVGGSAIKVNMGVIPAGEKITKKLAAGGISQVGQFLGNPPVPGAMIQVIADPEDTIKEIDNVKNNIKTVAPITADTSGASLVSIKNTAQEVLPDYDPAILPGDFLYPIKQAVQKVQEALTFSEQKKAKLAVVNAAKKAKEMEKLAKKKKYDVLPAAFEVYEEEIADAAAQLEALDPEDPATQDIAEIAFEEGLKTQALFGDIIEELSPEDLAIAADAQEAGMEATAEALIAMEDALDQKESIEEFLGHSEDPLAAVGHAAILEELGDHVAEALEEEALEEEEAVSEESVETDEELAAEIEEEGDEFEVFEGVSDDEFLFEGEEEGELTFPIFDTSPFTGEDEEEESFAYDGVSDDEFLIEEESPLEALIADVQEEQIEEAAVQIEILVEEYAPLISDYVEEMTEASATDVITVLVEVAEEAPTPAVLDIVEESTQKVVEKVSEQIAASPEPEKTAEILLSVEKKDPVKAMRALQKVSEHSKQAASSAVAAHVEKSFDKAVTDFANTLEQQTPKARTATIEKIARTAPDLTQVAVLEKVSERLAGIPTKQPEALRIAVATLQEKVIDQIRENIATAPNEEARRRAFFAAVGSGSENVSVAEQLQGTLGVSAEEIASARVDRAVAQERRAAFEQGIAPPERTAPVRTAEEEPATETEVIESRPADTKTDEQKDREEALRRKEVSDKKVEEDRLEKARRAELQKQQDEEKLREEAAEKLETAPVPRPSAGEAEKIERQTVPEKSVTTPRTTTTTQPKTRITPTTPSAPESTDVSPTRRTTATTTRPAVRQRPSQTTTSTTRQQSPASQTPIQRGTTTPQPTTRTIEPVPTESAQPTTRTTEPTPSQPTTRTTEPAPAPAPTPTRSAEPAPSPAPSPAPTRSSSVESSSGATSAPASAPTTDTTTRTRTQSVSLDSLFNNFVSEVGNSLTVVKNLLSFSVFAAMGFFLE